MNNLIRLHGNFVILEQLQPEHEHELYIAAQDPVIWTYSGSKAYKEKFYPWFQSASTKMAKQQHLPFVVRRLKDQKVIGSTRFYDIDYEHKRVAIGYTWYIPEAWGTEVNPECKFLLLQHAFEVMQMNRVEFSADERNQHSCAAIRKLGAKEEGRLRNHMITVDGFLRTTVLFSIIQSEWPTVKANLEKRVLKNF